MRWLLALILLAGLALLGTTPAPASASEWRGERHHGGHGWHGQGHGRGPVIVNIAAPVFYPPPLPVFYPVAVPIPVEVAVPVPYNLPPAFAGYPLGP